MAPASLGERVRRPHKTSGQPDNPLRRAHSVAANDDDQPGRYRGPPRASRFPEPHRAPSYNPQRGTAPPRLADRPSKLQSNVCTIKVHFVGGRLSTDYLRQGIVSPPESTTAPIAAGANGLAGARSPTHRLFGTTRPVRSGGVPTPPGCPPEIAPTLQVQPRPQKHSEELLLDQSRRQRRIVLSPVTDCGSADSADDHLRRKLKPCPSVPEDQRSQRGRRARAVRSHLPRQPDELARGGRATAQPTARRRGGGQRGPFA